MPRRLLRPRDNIHGLLVVLLGSAQPRLVVKQMVGSKLDTTKLLAPQSGAALPPLPPAPV